ncbi:MAG: diacylglycerol kinase family protein [Patescibacteria group bacterium]|nr:diacylglycerol kinase family protein [Patescibacteria group bacterium]
MNIFIYDSFLNHKKYDRLLARLETRLTDLGLNGKITRLSLTRNTGDTVKNELKRGATTIIAVGNNKTVNQVANSLYGTAVPLGVIPVGEKNNDIAKSLGIESADNACDILSARLLARLDVGMANHACFLGNASIVNQGTVINMSNDYTIEAETKGLIHIFNLTAVHIKLPPKVRVTPEDGILELAISSQRNQNIFSKKDDQSIFKIKKVAIDNAKAQLMLDGTVPIALPAEISVLKQSLNVIVGKNRNF